MADDTIYFVRQPDGTIGPAPIQWDAQGPYYPTRDGSKRYIPPAAAENNYDDPQIKAWGKAHQQQSGGLLHTRGTWNDQTGQYDSSVDWSNVLSLVVAGTITAGAATSLMGGGAAAESAATTAASTGSVDAGLSAAGLAPLASTATVAPVAAATGAGVAAVPTTAAGLSTLAAPALAAPVTAVAAQAAPAATGGLAAPAAASAGKGLSSWLTGPTAGLISQGIGLAGNIYATNKQADTAAAAAKIQADEYDKALAAAKEEQTYNRNQYASYLSRLDPYAQTGAAANDRLSAFMGQPARPTSRTDGGSTQPMPTFTPNQPGVPTPAINAQGQRVGTLTATPNPSGKLVTLQAPNGSTKDVPAEQVPDWIAAGAKLMGGQGAVA